MAALLFLLSAAAAWIARGEPGAAGGGFIALGAAGGDLAVLLVWCARTRFDAALAWEAAAVAVGLTLAFQAFVEIDLARRRRRPEPANSTDSEDGADPVLAATARSTAAAPALVTAAGFLLLLVVVPAAASAPPLWPWLAGWLALAALLVRQAELPGCEAARLGAAAGLGFGLSLYFAAHGRTPAAPPPGLFFAVEAAVAVAFHLLALGRRDPVQRRAAEIAAAILPAGLLAGLFSEAANPLLAPGLFLPVTVVFALLAVLAVTRLRSGGGYFGAVALLALVQTEWAAQRASLSLDADHVSLAFILLAATAVLATAWPFFAAAAFRGQRLAWVAAALAGPVWFLPSKGLFVARFGDGAIGILPVGLGVLALAAAYRARRLWPVDEPRRTSALAWFAAVALGFVSVAIPLQLDKEWITLGWALEGLAVTALWKRLDHPGLKWFGLALFAAVTARLVANPALLGYYPRSGWPILNWLAYTYLIPAGALLGSAAILGRHEVERRRPAEAAFYAAGHPVGAILCSLAAIAVVFVWINLTIFDAFATGPALAVTFEPLLARDLTLSLAWAVYALVLLAIGMAKDSSGLRWISLSFLVLTIGKVFLYDLGQLRDLYRVASLVGLAVSLIAVSLAYQRFVFRRKGGDDEQEPG